jgi:hypothetical protein
MSQGIGFVLAQLREFPGYGICGGRISDMIPEEVCRAFAIDEITIGNQPGNHPPMFEHLYRTSILDFAEELAEFPSDRSGTGFLHYV